MISLVYIFQMVLDYNDLKKIPIVNVLIRYATQSIVKIR